MDNLNWNVIQYKDDHREYVLTHKNLHGTAERSVHTLRLTALLRAGMRDSAHLECRRGRGASQTYARR